MPEVLKKKWTVLEEPDYNQILQLSLDTDIPFPLSKILIRRNVNNKADAKKFFVPDLKYLYDPFLLKNMDKAAQRLLKVIENKEKIMVFGDYDVDGTSGVSMFYCFLKNLGITTPVYIPDRFTEGYGLSKTGIRQAAENNIKLIIAIDYGITAFDKVEYAKSLGVEIIICDHHQPPEVIPEAYAVLDALQYGCNYPFKDLCGTGVAFKLIQAVCEKLGSDLHLSLLDFVAIATAADMVPVIDENRVLVHFGFKQIIENPRPSFLTLIKYAGFKIESLNTSSVAYALGPRINAVGRLGDANRAVEFLTCDDMSKVDSLAGVLESENINRKKIDSEIYSQAQISYESYLNRTPDTNDVAIVLHDPQWHPGVLGIIASRMVEKYYRPSIILTNFKGVAKGSARSINDFNIYDALKQCAAVFPGLIQFGGHYYAAGLEVEIEKIDEFRNTFNRIAKGIISLNSRGNDILIPEIKIDSELNLEDIDLRFVKILKHFEPFGPGNATPVFMSRKVEVVGEPRIYNGASGVTNVFKVRKLTDDVYKDRNVLECVFYQPDFRPQSTDETSIENLDIVGIKRNDVFDIVYSIEENHWNYKSKIQLRVRDMKYSNP